MGFREVVVRWFGEKVARKIERFVEGTVFGDEFVTCSACDTPVAATLLTQWAICPVCRTAATNNKMIEALEARRRAALAAGEAAKKEAEEIEALLAARRG